MRVLMLHNYYQRRGGEDQAAEQDVELLCDNGHEVLFRTWHNDEIRDWSVLRKACLPLRTIWSGVARRQVEDDIRSFRPDVVHVHNFFPLASPAVHRAASRLGIPVVQTLHNYRLLAPCGLLLRNEAVCERCIDGTLLNGVVFRCYRESALQSATVAAMIKAHRILRTWQEHVDRFIALTDFYRDTFVRCGWNPERMSLRPNYILDDPGPGSDSRSGAVFIGRLSAEKGVETVLEAWKELPDVPLHIIGDGPMLQSLRRRAEQLGLMSVEFHGWVQLADVLDMLKRVQVLVFPSIWYETFGRTIVESYATATPVLVSNMGAHASLVQPEHTGLLFTPGDAKDLARKARSMLSDAGRMRKWGNNARAVFEQEYTAGTALDRLIEIYDSAIKARDGGAGAGP